MRRATTASGGWNRLDETGLKEDGKIDRSFFRDGLHPNEEGYRKLVEKLAPYLLKPVASAMKPAEPGRRVKR